MNKYSALVENNLVINKAVGIPNGYIECSKEVQIGWTYENGEFFPPVEEEEQINE